MRRSTRVTSQGRAQALHGLDAAEAAADHYDVVACRRSCRVEDALGHRATRWPRRGARSLCSTSPAAADAMARRRCRTRRAVRRWCLSRASRGQARWATLSSARPAPVRASTTAEPMPPSGWWSSATTSRPPVAAAAGDSVAVSIGLTEYRSITRALMPSSRELVGRARQACRVTPAPISVTWSSAAGAEDLGAADRERLAGVVEHRVGAAGGPHVADAVRVGHGLDQGGGAGGVAGVEHGGAVHRAHHGQVLQGHLGRAVGADLHPGVGAGPGGCSPRRSAAIRMKS